MHNDMHVLLNDKNNSTRSKYSCQCIIIIFYIIIIKKTIIEFACTATGSTWPRRTSHYSSHTFAISYSDIIEPLRSLFRNRVRIPTRVVLQSVQTAADKATWVSAAADCRPAAAAALRLHGVADGNRSEWHAAHRCKIIARYIASFNVVYV